jgi:hypothetical protein
MRERCRRGRDRILVGFTDTVLIGGILHTINALSYGLGLGLWCITSLSKIFQ